MGDVICPTLCNKLDRERDSVPCRSSSACQTQPLPTPIWSDPLSRGDASQCDYEGMATGSRQIAVKTWCVALPVLFLLRRAVFSGHLSSWASWCLRLSITWGLQMSTGCCHTASGVEIAPMRFQSPYQPWAVSAVHGAARHIPYNIVTCCCMKSLCVVEGRARLRQMQSVNPTYSSSIPQ